MSRTLQILYGKLTAWKRFLTTASLQPWIYGPYKQIFQTRKELKLWKQF